MWRAASSASTSATSSRLVGAREHAHVGRDLLDVARGVQRVHERRARVGVDLRRRHERRLQVREQRRERIVDLVHDARGERADRREPLLRLDQRLGGAQRGLAGAPTTSLVRLAQLPLDRGRQAPQVRLHHVVVRAGLHRLHRGLFADLARDDEERDVDAGLLHDAQRRRRVEGGHRPVAHDRVPRLRAERRAERVGREHPRRPDHQAGVLQRALDEQRVRFDVLDEQHVQRRVHRPLRDGVRFNTSQ
jgi:hypothetical protein